jgi:hypothetical protein
VQAPYGLLSREVTHAIPDVHALKNQYSRVPAWKKKDN